MAYNMAKAAIDHMARTAAIELASNRIRVNIVHPGLTRTDRHAARMERQAATRNVSVADVEAGRVKSALKALAKRYGIPTSDP